MEVEANRLATFASWPNSFPIEVARIARCGFYATGRDQEVECHWCRQRISEWRYGDQVMTRHRQLDPLCPFITDPLTSGNVPTLHLSSSSSSASSTTAAQPQTPPPSPLTTTTTTTTTTSTTETAVDDADIVHVTSTTSDAAPDAGHDVHPQLRVGGGVEEPDNRDAGAGAVGGDTVSSSTRETMGSELSNGTTDDGPDYMNEQCRLDTFTNWPITCVTPRSLARAGFYYYNQSDHVRCAWCLGVIAKWEQGDDPFVEHSKFFPSCPRAICGPNVRMLACDEPSIEAIGIQPHQPSRHDAFASLDVRLQSFQTWQHGHIQRPEALAAAGFYYLDNDDYVRCFHCSGGLRTWLVDDDPWHEHAKFFPRCAFVELVRGRAFVQRVQAGQPVSLDAAMAGEWPRRALEMGFPLADVRQVVGQRLELMGGVYGTIDELVVAILSLKVAAAEMGVEAQVAEEQRVVTAAGQPDDAESVEGAVGGVATAGETPSANGSCGAAAVAGGVATAAASTASSTLMRASSGESLKAILSGSLGGGRTLNLEDENRKLKDAILCKVCMVEEVGIVFLPCGHLVSCVQCASSVSACPLCRTTIKAYVRTYLS